MGPLCFVSKQNMVKKDDRGTIQYAGLTFRVRVSRVRYSRIQFGEEGPQLILPRGMDPLVVLEQKRAWIIKTRDRLSEKRETAKTLPLSDRSEGELRELVAHLVSKYSRPLAVGAAVVKFRKMRRRWGSCRSDGVITLNRQLRFLPDYLIAYIVFHELLHLRLRRHDSVFKQRMAKQFPETRQWDGELESYGHRLLYRSSPPNPGPGSV